MCGQVVTLLIQCIQQYRTEHPDAEFPLLHHTEETLLRRVQALLYAPLFGIGKLTGYDVIEHPLATLAGRGYQGSTLNQFLGQLERVNAGEALLPAFLPKQTEARGSVMSHCHKNIPHIFCLYCWGLLGGVGQKRRFPCPIDNAQNYYSLFASGNTKR